MTRQFKDRQDAGKFLAGYLMHHADIDDALILALPRGGVPVAAEVAHQLHAPLDVFIVRKLGVPGHEELAMGAIASGGTRVLNRTVVEGLRISQSDIDHVTAAATNRLHQLERQYREGRPPPALANRTVILVDDGLATGSTMQAAAQAVAQHNPRQLIVAVPVASVEACNLLTQHADEVVCPFTPEPFQAVGMWYKDFAQTTDEEVRQLLAAHTHTP